MKLVFFIFLVCFFKQAFSQVPLSSSVKSSSYTVPARKWVVVQDLNGDLTLNGDTVTVSRAYSGSLVLNAGMEAFGETGLVSGTITGASGLGNLYVYKGAFGYNGTSFGCQAIGSYVVFQNAAGTKAFSMNVGQGECFYILNNRNSASTYSFNVTPLKAGALLKAPSGSVLNGSRYIVELYER